MRIIGCHKERKWAKVYPMGSKMGINLSDFFLSFPQSLKEIYIYLSLPQKQNTQKTCTIDLVQMKTEAKTLLDVKKKI